jgi:hypothetical protein
MMKVGDLVRDRRLQFCHEIGVVKRVIASSRNTHVYVIFWANGSFAGDTTEEGAEDIRLIEQN